MVYTIAEVADNTRPTNEKPIEIIIMFVDINLVDENKSNAIYIKKMSRSEIKALRFHKTARDV